MNDPDRAGFMTRARWAQALIGACLLIVLLGLLLPRVADKPAEGSTTSAGGVSPAAGTGRQDRSEPGRRFVLSPGATAEEIVASKLSQFTRKRRQTLEAMARQFKVTVPDEVARFFEAAEAGRWEEMQAGFETLKTLARSEGSGLNAIWGPIHETFGVAAEVREWPAQQLLDYGNAILGSLKPGMIYVGGTDPGRFIPTLLNETAEGESHVILTQNAFADKTYLDYVRFLYQDRLQALTQEDSQQAFNQYLVDAQKRLFHDQEAPNEVKQIRPGEDVRFIDNRVQVSGQVAVMGINEKLLQTLMEKNPAATFAMEQSFPLASTYEGATSLGPIMQLRVQEEQDALTRERAAQAIDYWQNTVQQLLANPDSAVSLAVQKTYSKMAAEQASLFLHHEYSAEAERAFQIAMEIYPANPEAVFRYTSFLVDQKRMDDALRVAAGGAKAAPENEQLRSLVQQLTKMKSK
jgi:hypothetical protein